MKIRNSFGEKEAIFVARILGYLLALVSLLAVIEITLLNRSIDSIRVEKANNLMDSLELRFPGESGVVVVVVPTIKTPQSLVNKTVYVIFGQITGTVYDVKESLGDTSIYNLNPLWKFFIFLLLSINLPIYRIHPGVAGLNLMLRSYLLFLVIGDYNLHLTWL